ncbi:MAG TPA: hypothetical protein VKT82_25120 [Ktedonobacterales bacterium]|nr:hypothetical protein [Ktedonobacterales bacterium]
MAGNREPPPEPPPDPKPAPNASELPPASPLGEEVSGPEETKILQAMAFYREALQQGPRLSREVLAEGKQQGHAQRTQERARSRLNVQSWPDGFQGPRLIALPKDQAVAAVKQRRQQKRERAGNGRRKQRNGGGRKSGTELMTPIG